MKITSVRPYIPQDQPQLPSQQVRHAAMTAHLAHQLGAGAPSAPSSVGATSTIADVTDTTLQALYDIAQLHMLYSSGGSAAAIANVYADLLALSTNPNLYSSPVTISFGQGGGTSITFEPSDIVKTVLSFQTAADPAGTFNNAFLNATPYVPPQANNMPALDQVIYAMISSSDTDDDFDFTFSNPAFSPQQQLMDMAESYLIIASLMNVSTIGALGNLDNWWKCSDPTHPGTINYMIFPQILMAAVIMKNTDSSGTTNWTQVNADLAAFRAMLPGPNSNPPVPAGSTNYLNAFNKIQSLTGNYTSMGAAWRAVGLPINMSMQNVVSQCLDFWDNFAQGKLA